MSQSIQYQGGGWPDIGPAGPTPFNIANQVGPGPGMPVVGGPPMRPDAYMQPVAGAGGLTNYAAGPGSQNVTPYGGELGAPRAAYESFDGAGGYSYRIYSDGRIEVSQNGTFPGKTITAQSHPIPYRAIMAEFQASAARSGRRINPAVLLAMLRALGTVASSLRTADVSVVTPSAAVEAAPAAIAPAPTVARVAPSGGIPWWTKLLGTAILGGIGFYLWRRSGKKS